MVLNLKLFKKLADQGRLTLFPEAVKTGINDPASTPQTKQRYVGPKLTQSIYALEFNKVVGINF
jgi:hypothetical protein